VRNICFVKKNRVRNIKISRHYVIRGRTSSEDCLEALELIMIRIISILINKWFSRGNFTLFHATHLMSMLEIIF
jgi:hypothetical protein